jgi:hypothetical protein
MSRELAPGKTAIMDDPGTLTSGFSVLGIVRRARIPTTVRNTKTIHVKEELSMANLGSLMAEQDLSG